MELLLVSDPQRFLEHVLRDLPEERWDGLKTLDDIFLCEILRYGIYPDAGMLPDLTHFYSERFLPVPSERRREVFRHVLDMVENVDFVSFNAFLPFVVGDDDRGIVATAVIDYVSLAPVFNDDPMSHVREVVGMIERGMPKNEGAVFGALLHIGDPRVCKLIWPLRDGLDIDSLHEAVNCQSGFISACTADFYIDWPGHGALSRPTSPSRPKPAARRDFQSSPQTTVETVSHLLNSTSGPRGLAVL